MAFGPLLCHRATQDTGETSNSNTSLRVSGGGSWGNGAETIETKAASTAGHIIHDANDADHGGGANTNYFMMGFSRESDTTATGFSGIRYACYVRQNDLRVYESGTEK